MGQLKYYPWLKNARPTSVPEDRGLTAWKPERHAWAFGAGFTVGAGVYGTDIGQSECVGGQKVCDARALAWVSWRF